MKLRSASILPLAAGLALAGAADAATFTFNTDPFAGSTALTTPGRQIVGGEVSIPLFDFAQDTILIDPAVFGVSSLTLFNGVAADIPASGASIIVLRTLDSDGNAANGNQLAAGSAANLIADRVTTPGAGFFIYFNSGLDLPRLVFSTDLDSNQADLKILARFTGLTGSAGAGALGQFGAANFAAVPEPATWAMLIAGFGLIGASVRRTSAAASRRAAPA
jgi:hypothetical protein